MSSRRLPGARADRPGPPAVPFIGWSCAAHEFRVKAAQLAPAGDVLPLFIGDPGVGRRCMAAAWRHAAGLDADVPIIDLDTCVGDLPRRCLGYTTRRPERGRHCILLGRGFRGNAPGGRPGAEPLPAQLLQRFGVALYVPPIHGEREIDILAHLDYVNRIRFPRAGFRYRAVHAPLICRMIYDCDWPANFSGLSYYLDLVAARDRREADSRDATGVRVGDSRPTEVVLPVLREREEIPWFARRVDWRCDAEEVLLDALPDLAVRIYARHCELGPRDGNRDRDWEVDADPRHTLLPENQWNAGNGMTVRDVLDISPDAFVRDWLLLGLPVNSPKRQDYCRSLLDRVRDLPIFGATLASLQAGLAVDLPGVADALEPGMQPGPVFKRAAGGHSGDQSADPASAQRLDPIEASARFSAGADAPAGWSANRFCIEDGTYHIIFLAPGGHIERARPPVDGNLGLLYYRHLIRVPETAFSARQLIALARDPQAAGSGMPLDDQEFGGEHTPTRQEAIDQEALRSYQERLADLQRNRLRAERQGDTLELQEIDEERQAINRELDKAFHRNKVKNIDGEARKLHDRVRRALEAARIKLSRSKMPGLADYLAQQVSYKGGGWTYRPARSAPHWQT